MPFQANGQPRWMPSYFSVRPDAVVLAHEQAHERSAPDLRSDVAGGANSGLVQLVLALDAQVQGGSGRGRIMTVCNIPMFNSTDSIN